MDNLGKSKQIDRVAYGLEEAKQLERELNYKIKEETPAKRISLQELCNEYLNAKQYEVRETSLDKTKKNLSLYVLPLLGDIKIGNFKSTIQPKKDMDYYTAKEFKAFIAVIKEKSIKSEQSDNFFEWNYYVFFNIAFYTGLRKGEIHALQWTDIKDGYLSVTKSLAQKLKGGDRITAPKNSSSIRTLQMPEPLINILNDHYKRCSKIDGFNEAYKICGGLSALRDSTINKRNKTYADLACVKSIRIHDFRHSHASLLANEGINIQEIARRLGHAKIEETWNTYSHLYPREEERAIQILNEIV